MASKKVGTLIKEARTEAGLTQEQLARRIAGLSANDISLAERHQKNLTQEQLKQIAKITGVTQASLLNAAKGTSSGKTSGSKSSMQVTAAERRLVELYRKATTEERKDALKALKGESSLADDIMESLIDSVADMLTGYYVEFRGSNGSSAFRFTGSVPLPACCAAAPAEHAPGHCGA